METVAAQYQMEKSEQEKWAAVNFLGEKWDGHLKELPSHYLINFALLTFDGDKLRAWVNIEFHAMSEAMHIPADKYLRGMEFAERSGFPFVSVHAYPNGDIWYMKVENSGERAQIGWRGVPPVSIDGGNEYPCVYFKSMSMKLFKTYEDF